MSETVLCVIATTPETRRDTLNVRNDAGTRCEKIQMLFVIVIIFTVFLFKSYFIIATSSRNHATPT